MCAYQTDVAGVCPAAWQKCNAGRSNTGPYFFAASLQHNKKFCSAAQARQRSMGTAAQQHKNFLLDIEQTVQYNGDIIYR